MFFPKSRRPPDVDSSEEPSHYTTVLSKTADKNIKHISMIRTSQTRTGVQKENETGANGQQDGDEAPP